VGPAARALPLRARTPWPAPAGAPALLAWATCRPSRARGGRGRASRRGSEPVAGRPREPVSPASGPGVCRRPSPSGRACRRAPPARGRPRVCLCRRRRRGHPRRRRPRPGTAGPPTAPLALAGAPRAWGSRQPPPKAAAARPPRWRAALAWACAPQPCSPLQRRRGGPAWPPPCGQRRRRMSRGSRRSRPNLARWHRAVAGARLPPRAVPCGGSTPNGRRPGPGSRSWGAACRRSSTGRSACLSATMRRTSLGSKAQRRRPPRPWSAPSLPRERWCHGLWGISQAARAMASRTIICSSARPWVLSRPGISAWPQSKMHGRVPHPLERGLRRFYSHRPHPP